MRTRLQSLALALLLFTGWSTTARAAVHASGLLCTPTGVATADVSADGRRLAVLNIGSSGQDGVDVSLVGMEGSSLSWQDDWTTPNAGQVLSFSWGVSNPSSVGTGSAAHGRLSLLHTPGGLSVTCDMSELGSSPTMRCLLYRNNALITEVEMPKLSTVEFTIPPGGGPVGTEVGFEVSRVRESPTRCCRNGASYMTFNRDVLFVFGGQSVVCDRMVCVGDLDGDGLLDACAVRVTAPVLSSTNEIFFDSQSFVRFGVRVTASGGNVVSACCLDDDSDDDGVPDTFSLHNNPAFQEASMSGQMPMLHQVFGSSAGGPDNAAILAVLESRSPPMGLVFSSLRPLTLDPATDNGAALECVVRGTGGCSATGALASCKVSVQDLHVTARASFAGMCADQESVLVISHAPSLANGAVVGIVVGAVVGGVVTVTPPSGGPRVTPVAACGATGPRSRSNVRNNLSASDDHVGLRLPADEATDFPLATASTSTDGLELSVRFADERVFCVGGTCFTGDELVFRGQCASGTCGSSVITVTGTNFGMQQCLSGACSGGSGSLEISGVALGSTDQIHASIPATVALSSATPVVEIPVLMERVDATPLRGTTVTFHTSPNIVLASVVRENTMFSSVSNSQMFVIDNGGGSYTVDCALLGPGCGPTASGSLFSVFVTRAPGAPDGMAYLSIDEAEAADCTAGPIPTSPGGRAYIVLDSSPPNVVTGLAATQVKSGNPVPGQTTRVAVSWAPLALDASLELYRAPFGNYPSYDNGAAAGSVPPLPSYPPGGRWSPVSLTCSATTIGTEECDDFTSSRDFYYYVAFARDRAGNVSPASSLTTGTLNYHLGDVAGGGAVCAGDDQVSTADISALGSSYGVTFPVGSALQCLDIGPTSTGTVDGLPLTDQRLSFRDLILYAINYSLVSIPASRPQPAAVNALRVTSAGVPAVGQTFAVALDMEGAGDVQGLSAQLDWDPAVVEPVGVDEGELIARQGQPGVVLSPGAGGVDAAMLGVGGGIAGSGTLAKVTFRVKAAGDPAIRIGAVDARDAQNRTLGLSTSGGAGSLPGRTALRMAFPNPFDQNMTIALALSHQGPASVGVFDVAGRKVRSLLQGVQPAGERLVTWDGRDDSGARLGAGVYMLRLDTGGHSETRAVRLVR